MAVVSHVWPGPILSKGRNIACSKGTLHSHRTPGQNPWNGFGKSPAFLAVMTMYNAAALCAQVKQRPQFEICLGAAQKALAVAQNARRSSPIAL